MGIKLIFLDFDGVLNSSLSSEVRIYYPNQARHYIYQANLDILRLMADKTGAKIIISSTWKKDSNFIGHHVSENEIIAKFQELFSTHGWNNAPIIGMTPNLSGFRGEEVATFLDNFSKQYTIDDYLILDDGIDFFTNFNNLSEYQLAKFGFDVHPRGARPFWENQPLIQINPLTGLTYSNLIEVLQKWQPEDSLVQEFLDYQPYIKNSCKKNNFC